MWVFFGFWKSNSRYKYDFVRRFFLLLFKSKSVIVGEATKPFNRCYKTSQSYETILFIQLKNVFGHLMHYMYCIKNQS